MNYISKADSVLLFSQFSDSVALLHLAHSLATTSFPSRVHWLWQCFNKFHWRRLLKQIK